MEKRANICVDPRKIEEKEQEQTAVFILFMGVGRLLTLILDNLPPCRGGRD
jgi:hypothetical protein